MIDQVRGVSLAFYLKPQAPIRRPAESSAYRNGVLKVYYTAQSFERLQKDSTILIR